MTSLSRLLNGKSYKMFFFWIIPIVNAVMALAQNLSDNKRFGVMNLVNELVVTILNPYLIGAIWLIIYSFWKGLTRIKKQEIPLRKQNQSSVADNLDFEIINLKNYTKFVFYVWIIQLPFVLFSLM